METLTLQKCKEEIMVILEKYNAYLYLYCNIDCKGHGVIDVTLRNSSQNSIEFSKSHFMTQEFFLNNE